MFIYNKDFTRLKMENAFETNIGNFYAPRREINQSYFSKLKTYGVCVLIAATAHIVPKLNNPFNKKTLPIIKNQSEMYQTTQKNIADLVTLESATLDSLTTTQYINNIHLDTMRVGQKEEPVGLGNYLSEKSLPRNLTSIKLR
jgi:hypothetical protein